MRYLMPPDLLVSTWSRWTSGRGRCRLRERSGNAKHIHWSNWRRDEQASQQSPEEQFDSVHNPPFYRYCGAIETR